MADSITFYGAARTVTGSRHFLQLEGHPVLVDCGLYQGSRELADKNRDPFQFDPKKIEKLVLTHAHLDHLGLIPRLVDEGFTGEVICTPATEALAKISLPDSGRIQEEDAYHHNKRHHDNPIQPLYNERQALAALKQFRTREYYEIFDLPGGAQCRFMPAGHILGSAMAEIFLKSGARILMSGDLGRYNRPLIKDPAAVDSADYLVIESTYGDRLHPVEDTLEHLERVIKDAVETQSAILIPSFSIGRTQELLYYISQLQDQHRIPRIPIFLDSPMATSTTALYRRFYEDLDPDMIKAFEANESLLEPDGVHFVRDRNESKSLNNRPGPFILIAGSGMATGGRIVHHLMLRLPQEQTTVLFTGFQSEGTLGRRLLDGASTVHIMGQEIEVRAKVDRLKSLSAHADQADLMHWMGQFKSQPQLTFIVHGEPDAQNALQDKIVSTLGWDVVIPNEGDHFPLNPPTAS